jgi:4-amino-4-deoxy-L-arabinose transferase-like glycosyltransferase
MLAVLAAMLLLVGSDHLPMMDRDEPRFAHATVEMVQRSSWAVPYFNGEYRFDKPPLTYWWMALHYKLLGVSELAARMHSIVAAWLIALVLRSMATAWASARAGLLTGAVWLTMFQVFVHGRLAVADMPLVLCVTLTMRALMQLTLHPADRWNRWHWWLYLSLGFGFLAKGPLALVVPGLALVLQRWIFWRKPMSYHAFRWMPGLLLSLAIVAAWGIPALVETNGLFWQVGMGEHVVERGTQAFNGRFPVPGYYLVTALLSLFPWIMFLPLVWRSVRQSWSEQQAWLVSWFTAPYVIFTLYATQLPHYVMPGFPAAALLVGLKLCAEPACSKRGFPVLVNALWVTLAIAALALGYGVGWPDGLATIIICAGWLLAAFALFGIVLTWQKWCRFAWFALIPAAWFAHMTCLAIREVHAGAQIAQVGIPAGRLVTWRFNEPSLVFHSGRAWKFTNKLDICERELNKGDVGCAVLLRREWTLSKAVEPFLKGDAATLPPATDESESVDALVSRHPRFQVSQLWVFNAARSSWAELTILRRE